MKMSVGNEKKIALKTSLSFVHITLNLLKQETTCKRSIAEKRLLAGGDTNYMEKILFKS